MEKQLFPKIRSEIHFNRYIRFIEDRQNREFSNEEKIHFHHILPKCYCIEDKEYLRKDRSNLIQLTPREHYIAHMILWKALGGEMTQAFWFITHCKQYGDKRVTSHQYEELVKDYSDRKSQARKGKTYIEIFGEKESKRIIESIQLNRRPINYTLGLRQKLRKAALNKPKPSASSVEKRRLKILGKKRTEEQKEHYRKGSINRKRKSCPICGKKITNANFKKHYDACKYLQENPKVLTRKGSTTGRVWINFKGEKRKLVSKENLVSYLDRGWNQGQSKKYKKDKGLL